MTKVDYKQITQSILSELPDRQREVIERRFGLVNKEKETLQKVGKDFGVTRERVRQIEKESFNKLRKKEDALKTVFVNFSDYLKKNGGHKREDILISDLSNNCNEHIHFLLCLGNEFNKEKEDKDVYPFWALDVQAKDKIQKEIEPLIRELKASKKPMKQDYIYKLANKSSIEITRHVERGPLGEYGLSTWPEIKPKGVRDTAFLVLKKEENPIHFRDIADLSNQLKAQQRKVLPQTVHNELIRDPRFVLVGRGIYALKEWGYETGTVKDVIVSTLKKSKNPLTKKEILEKVKKQRMVKDNTVFLNLSDKNSFQKNSEGKYEIKTA